MDSKFGQEVNAACLCLPKVEEQQKRGMDGHTSEQPDLVHTMMCRRSAWRFEPRIHADVPPSCHDLLGLHKRQMRRIRVE